MADATSLPLSIGKVQAKATGVAQRQAEASLEFAVAVEATGKRLPESDQSGG